MTEYGKWRSLIDGAGVIPDSVVDRPTDDNTGSGPIEVGVQIEVTNEWPKIQGEVSANTSGVTRGIIYRHSDQTVMGSTTFSSASSGFIFTIDLDNNLVSGETYDFFLDNQGSDFTRGSYTSPSFPYTSADGNLSIVNGVNGNFDTENRTYAIQQLGNINL